MFLSKENDYGELTFEVYTFPDLAHYRRDGGFL